MLLKRLLYDDYQSHLIMLPFFYKSGCHHLFFEFGHLLSECIDREDYAPATIGWLNIAQRLLTSNISKPKVDNRIQQEGFELKLYLAVCQEFTKSVLIAFFDAAIASSLLEKKQTKVLEQIIDTFRLLAAGLIQLHDMDRKDNEPTQEILINEIDTEKVQRLVEMGFSQVVPNLHIQ